MKQPVQSQESFEDISILIWNYLVERDWQHLEPQNLAISIALEANELLEHYQWTQEPVGSKEDLSDELADILIYAFQFAQQNDIDIAQAIRNKLAKTTKKYPAEAFKGKKGDEERAAWIAAKANFKKEGL
jgi:dCTP diphosphatase